MNNAKALIITGPTASGKTQLSEMIAEKYPCEIINADVGQFYKPLSVGTAKPNLSIVSYKHHLFDLIDNPEDLSVVKYRELVSALVHDICARGKMPVIVGGSLFYIKSLFFPPQELVEQNNCKNFDLDLMDSAQQWNLLGEIDSERAAKLHPNDIYRIRRALEIWFKTGIKPSEYKPKFEPRFDAIIVYVQPELEILKKRICTRTVQMIEHGGWIEETEKLLGSNWEPFLKIKNLIGYPEIFDWIKAGKKKSELPDLISKIQIQTMQYSKRQRTFWKSFEKALDQSSTESEFMIKSMSVGLPDEYVLAVVLNAWQKI